MKTPLNSSEQRVASSEQLPKMGRPHLDPAARAHRTKVLLAELSRDQPNLKLAAHALGVSLETATKDAHALGWRCMWASAEERLALQTGRKFFRQAAA